MRLNKDQLNKIKSKYKVDRLWSWSMINTFMTSHYEYYLKYIKREPEDLQNCVYGTMGTIAHNTIEKLYSNKINFEDLDNEFEDGWTTAVAISDLKFDRNDEEHNKKLAENYYANLKHFFNNHSVLHRKLALESFAIANINDNILQGYIDAVYKDEDGVYHIIDWKTSSMYKGKTAEEKSGQLVVYAIALNQKGVPFNQIKICWNFLKYVSIEYHQKNGSIKTREVERCKIGEALQSNAKMWLKAYDYSDNEIENYLKQLIDDNSIDVLPDDVKAQYQIKDCYIYVPLTEDLVEHWVNLITQTIKDIEMRESDYQETNNDKLFWDSEESVKAQSYYFATLSGYSPRLHLPYKQYLEQLESAANGEDMFGGVGDSIKNENISVADTDLSWLDEI